MGNAPIAPITHDHRKLFPQIYGLQPGPVLIFHMPKLQYVAQDMVTDLHMDWAGHPEPLDEPWVIAKVVNQLKQLTKTSFGYRFKLMPHELIWHGRHDNGKHSVTHMMQVPDCITWEMFDEANARVAANLRGTSVPVTRLVGAESVLCAQKLHVGHYRDTSSTYEQIKAYVEQQGYRVIGDRREIYLTPAMHCHAPETWRTIINVEIEDLGR
jgi:hypothetical protein